MKQLNKLMKFILPVFLLAITVAGVSSLNSSFRRSTGASGANCNPNSPQAFLGYTTKSPFNTTTLELDYSKPGAYYLKVQDSNGVPCVNRAIDIQSRNCPNGACSNWSATTLRWKRFSTDRSGVIRIDYNPFPLNFISEARIRVNGVTTETWSNPWRTSYTAKAPIQTFSTSVQSISPNINLREYWNNKPGLVWQYSTVISNGNRINPVVTTRVATEVQTRICSISTVPWRYTKTNVNYYWNASKEQDQRWFVTDANYTGPFSNYVIAVSAKKYVRSSFQEIDFKNPLAYQSIYSTLGNSSSVPFYNLAPVTATLPYIASSKAANPPSSSISACPEVLPANQTPLKDWYVRISQPENMTIGPVSGSTVKIDFFATEQPGTITTPGLGFERETWYMMKNVGPVRILRKAFSFDGTVSQQDIANDFCLNDSDCYGENIESPTHQIDISNFWDWNALKFDVQISRGKACSTGWTTSLTTTRSEGYCLRTLANGNFTPYNGFLEARAGYSNNNIFPSESTWQTRKWPYYINNGVVTLDTSRNAVGTYKAYFRPWIPNETDIPGETRTGQNNLRWSSQVTVVNN